MGLCPHSIVVATAAIPYPVSPVPLPCITQPLLTHIMAAWLLTETALQSEEEEEPSPVANPTVDDSDAAAHQKPSIKTRCLRQKMLAPMLEEEEARDEDGAQDEKAECLEPEDNKDFSTSSPRPAHEVSDASGEESELQSSLLSPSPKRTSPRPEGETQKKKKGSITSIVNKEGGIPRGFTSIPCPLSITREGGIR